MTNPTVPPATDVKYPWSNESLSSVRLENNSFLTSEEGRNYLRWELWMDKQFRTERWSIDIDSESGFGELHRVMCKLAEGSSLR